MEKLSIIIPAYNEEKTLAEIVKKVKEEGNFQVCSIQTLYFSAFLFK